MRSSPGWILAIEGRQGVMGSNGPGERCSQDAMQVAR
jgi:hypothetical protein